MTGVHIVEGVLVYLQLFATVMVSCYLFREWSRLLYQTHRKQKERPGILVLNWSLGGSARGSAQAGEDIRKTGISAPAIDDAGGEKEDIQKEQDTISS